MSMGSLENDFGCERSECSHADPKPFLSTIYFFWSGVCSPEPEKKKEKRGQGERLHNYFA